ncbi:MAG: RagB/SusD family nutrient uptake outer membrane protein [Chitinophagaceae bacterium]|nr:RagB/SusD family nutrient uptake outer membrane protein [Chitinophagaceae bacterium]
MRSLSIKCLICFVSLTMFGCTKLNEKVLDESSVTGLTDKQLAEGLIAPVYNVLPDIFYHTRYFALQEISSDEAILPYRGGTDWGDNGIYVSMHRHETVSTDPNVQSTWTNIVTGLSRSVTAITALKTNKDASAPLFLAEARAMRAFYSLLTLDLFNVVFIKEDPNGTSKVVRGDQAIQYIESELLAVEPVLDNSAGPGRITKAGVWGLLARLYLNAAVYRDRYAAAFSFKGDDMNKVIDYCNKIISSGSYTLAPEYFSIFNNDNHGNKEIVFAVDQRPDLSNSHNRMAYFSLSGDQFPLPAFTSANGTDGPAITPDFYETWAAANTPVDPAAADPRFYKENLPQVDGCVDAAAFNINRGILRGQQYGLTKDASGAFVKCPDGKLQVSKLYNVTRSKPTLPVDFTEQVDFTTAGSNYSTGYRVEKYEFSKSSNSGRNKGEADIIILRLADAYLMRAEAKLRGTNDAAGALADVNIVRAARTATTPAAPLTSMSLDLLFRERGFEFYWEMLRRTDMVRFGKYEGSWTEKSSTDKNKRVFPIPQTAIDAASNIPNYLKQNDGY